MPEFVKLVLWGALLVVVVLAVLIAATGAILAITHKIGLPLGNWRMRRALEKLAMWRAKRDAYDVYAKRTRSYHHNWEEYQRVVGLEAKYLERANILLAIRNKAKVSDEAEQNN
jgi:hypothetical protein